MTLIAIEGVYEDGKIELYEQPAGVHKACVVVTFLPQETAHYNMVPKWERKP